MSSTSVCRRVNVVLTAMAAFLVASAISAPTPNQALADGPLDLTTAAHGADVGRCEAQKPLLDAAFRDAIDMASAAVRAIDRVKLGRDNWIAFSDEARISASLQAVFGVKTGAFKEPMTETDSGRLEVVQGLYRSIARAFGTKKGEAVKLSCDDECSGHAEPFVEIGSGSGNKRTTFCPIAFDRNQHLSSLMALKTNQGAIAANTHIDTYRTSLPSTFLRELVRLVSQNFVMGKTDGYSKHTYADCAFLARDRPEMAIRNADSYDHFALSVWLDNIDWANGFAQKRPDTEDDEQMQRAGGKEYNDARVIGGKEVHGLIDVEQAQMAKEMINTMTKTQLEYKATDLPKPTKHSSFVDVGLDEVAEL